MFIVHKQLIIVILTALWDSDHMLYFVFLLKIHGCDMNPAGVYAYKYIEL